MASKRAERLSNQIQKELSFIFQSFQDLGSCYVSVTDVVVSRDFSDAKVYLSLLNLESDLNQEDLADHTLFFKDLKKQMPYIRHLLAERLHIRRVPILRFFHDTRLDEMDKMKRQLDNL